MGLFRKREKNAANKVDVAAAEGDVVKQISQSQAIKSAQGSSSGGPFTRAIVVEVIGEPEVFLENALKEDGPYEKNLKHIDSVKAAPRNSLIIQSLDEKVATQYDIAYPMMSSHIMMPIKVGEQVWIYDDGAPYKFWFSRIGGSGVAEDVNFTHKDREKETPLEEEKDAKSKADKAQGKKKNFIPRNNEGKGGAVGGEKSGPDGAGANILKQTAIGVKHVQEAVPRISPRPGDLILQGSNNSAILMTTGERGWSKMDEDFSQSASQKENEHTGPGTGTIDIVVGRGAKSADFKETDSEGTGDAVSRTSAKRIKTAEGEIETNKIAKTNAEDVNRAEGDPDFHEDLSRIYVSMNCEVDHCFALNDEYIPAVDGEHESKKDSTIAMKSNEIRVISREDGSIRIIKEKGEEGAAAQIIIDSSGTIHIQGEKIMIGHSGGSGEGPGGSEPYVKYSELKSYLHDIHAALNGFCQTLLTHAIPLFGVSPQINSAAASLQSELNIYKNNIEKIPSDKIYGE